MQEFLNYLATDINGQIAEVGALGASLIVMFYLAKAVYELVKKKVGLDGQNGQWVEALNAHTTAMRENVRDMERVLKDDRKERFDAQKRYTDQLMTVDRSLGRHMAKFDAWIESGVIGFRRSGAD